MQVQFSKKNLKLTSAFMITYMGFIRTAGRCKEPSTPWSALAATPTCSKNEFREANWEGIAVYCTDGVLYYVGSRSWPRTTSCCAAAVIGSQRG